MLLHWVGKEIMLQAVQLNLLSGWHGPSLSHPQTSPSTGDTVDDGALASLEWIIREMRWELTLLFYCLLPSGLYGKLLNVVTSFNPYNTSLRCERRKLRCGEVKWHSQGQTFHVLSDEAPTPLCTRLVCYFLVAALLCRPVSSYWRSRTHPCNIFLEW